MLDKIQWRSLLPSCIQVQPDPSSKSEPKKNLTKRSTSFQRKSFSDLSNPASPEDLSISLVGSNLYVFTVAELKVITQSFSSSNFLGEGGFGPVHKGFVDEKLRPGLKAQPVAVKLLDLEGAQGHREWLAEVTFLGQLRHPHLVKLIGYCCEDEHRLLVYEYMTKGSLENHLFKRFSATLPWSTRLKIAVGAAKGLTFLHEAERPVIYRDFKASNILLDSDFTAKLSDFGLAKDGPEGDKSHVSTRVMGTEGYAAPEYVMTGHLTAKSDVYSYGVVLLELLTGRRSMDKRRPQREQNLVDWARPYLNNPRKLNRIMDPTLDGLYSHTAAKEAAALAYQCLNPRPKNRPSMRNIVETLEPLQAMVTDIPIEHFVYTVAHENNKEEDEKKPVAKENGHRHSHRSHETVNAENNREERVKKPEAKESRHHRSHRQGARPSPTVAALSNNIEGTLYKNSRHLVSANSPTHRGRGA